MSPSPLILVLTAFIISTLARVGGAVAHRGTPTSSGYHDGYYYNFETFTEDTDANYTNLDGGTFRVEWGSRGGFGGGKGWDKGAWDRVVTYDGTLLFNGMTWFGIHGWTRNPLVEYYIIEYSHFVPDSHAQPKGVTTCNDLDYRLSKAFRVQQPSVDGTLANFTEFWSVRSRKQRVLPHANGTINVGCHFDAWKGAGMELGNEFEWQIFETLGYFSTGAAEFTVSEA